MPQIGIQKCQKFSKAAIAEHMHIYENFDNAIFKVGGKNGIIKNIFSVIVGLYFKQNSRSKE